MKSLYIVSIGGCEVTCVGVAAISKVHAANCATKRLKEYGYTEQEFTIKNIKHSGQCKWDLENTVIYY